MHNDKLQVIKELMEELIGEMDYGKDDFDERLGKNVSKEMPMEVEGEMAKPEGDFHEMSDGEIMPGKEHVEEEEEDDEDEMDARIQRLMSSK